MKNIVYLNICMIVFTISLFSQINKNLLNVNEPLRITTLPTAGVLQKGKLNIYNSNELGGNSLFMLSYAPFTNFTFGLSYLANNFIGTGTTDFQKYPGINLRYRIYDESLLLPAFTLGIETQGRRRYFKNAERFEQIATGVFLSASRNFKWLLGYTSLHAGVSYSVFEKQLENNGIPLNMYGGLEQTLGKYFSISGELNTNLNDNNSLINNKKPIINLSLKYALTSEFNLELRADDVLGNFKTTNGYSRALAFEYFLNF